MRNFTKEETLLATLRGKFASQFARRFGEMEPEMVEMIIKGALFGITEEQFNQGMTRLLAPGNKFMPDIAEFQSWCVSGSWWTVDEAWQRACDYSNQSEQDLLKGKLKITALAKKAWDSVYWVVEQGNMKEASRQFKSIYETYLSKAIMTGRQQEWYVPPVMIGTKTKIAEPKVWKTKMSESSQRILDLTTAYMKDGMGWGDAFKKAELEVKGVTKPMFKVVA